MNARSLLPAIANYPDLEEQFNTRIAQSSHKRCGGNCGMSKLVAKYRILIEAKQKRDKRYRRG